MDGVTVLMGMDSTRHWEKRRDVHGRILDRRNRSYYTQVVRSYNTSRHTIQFWPAIPVSVLNVKTFALRKKSLSLHRLLFTLLLGFPMLIIILKYFINSPMRRVLVKSSLANIVSRPTVIIDPLNRAPNTLHHHCGTV